MAVARVPETAIRLAFEEGDLEMIQNEIMRRYWAHVRDLLRKVPVFDEKLDFLANYFEKPPHEVLDAIATVRFPQLTIAIAQKNHNLLRKWINELVDEALE